MRKLFLTFSLLVLMIFVSGCVQQEEKPEGNVTFIDGHVHFCSRDNAIQIADRFMEEMDKTNISKTVLFGCCDQPYFDKNLYVNGIRREADEKVLEAYKRHPNRFYPMLSGFDPQNPNSVEYLDQQLATGIWKGLGEIYLIQFSMLNYKTIADHPNMMRIYRVLAKYNVPIFFHYERRSQEDVDAMYRALEQNPDVKFVWVHLGGSGPGEVEKIENELARYPNLYLLWEVPISKTMEKNKGFLNLLERYPDRFMIGSDVGCTENFTAPTDCPNPPECLTSSYGNAIAIHRELLSKLSPETAKRIAYKNLKELMGEPVEEPESKYNVPSTYYAMDNVHEVAVNPNRKELYTASLHTSLIVVIDINSTDYPVLGEIELPGGESVNMPHIVFSSDGSYAYVAHSYNSEYIASWGLQNVSYIAVINTTTRKIARIIYPPYELSGFLAPSPDGRWLYFNTQSSSDISRGIGKLNLQSGEVVGFLPLRIDSSFITLSKDGKYIYATQGRHQQGENHPLGFENGPFHLFTVIDAESLRVISSVEVGDSPQYIAITPDGTKAYVSNHWSNDVSVINLSIMKVIANITVGFEPNEIVFTPDGNKAYVSLPGNAQMLAGGPGYLCTNRVGVIDTKQNVLLSSIDVHQDPISVAMDPDGTKVYVADGGANGPTDYAEVHIIATADDTYLRPIYIRKPAQYAPSGIDITPDNKKLFVTTSNFTNFPKERLKENLLVIDVATSNVTNKLDIDAQAVKVSKDGSKVYVFVPASDTSEAELLIIDSNSLRTLKSINLGKIGNLGGGIFTNRILLNSTETVAYVNYQVWDINWAPKGATWPEWIDSNDTGLIAVDLINGKVDKIFYSKIPSVNYHGIVLTPDQTRLFVSDSASQTVVVINTLTYEEIARIPVGRSPSEVKISKDGKYIYVLQMFGSPMTIIDANTYRVMKTVDFSFVHAQMDFELSSDERYFYAAEFDSNFVLVYDLQENKVVKVIDTGLDPLDMTITPDGHYIYVGEVTGDGINMIDTITNNLVKRIDLKKIVK